MRVLRLVGFLALLVVTAARAEAGPIAARAALDTLLGPAAVNEDFEAYAIASGYAQVGATVDSTTVVNGQGPGLLVPGATLSTLSGDIVWQADGFYSMPTKTIGTFNSADLTVSFTTFVDAFGVDLLNYGGYPSTYNVTVYALDDTTVIGSIAGISFGSAVTPYFVGFENALGIGGFRVDSVTGVGPVIDNLEFGTVVPEPGSLALLGTGLAAAVRSIRRRRRTSEQ